MSWFSKHPNWLYSESIELSNNSIYKESYQYIDRCLVSAGNIILHKEKTAYFPILIAYPDATPYLPPIVFILETLPSDSEVKELSKVSTEVISKSLSKKARYFNRRHQNEDGSVCFIETSDLHGGNAEVFSIKDILKRIRIWLAGRIPKDSREVELFYHFRRRCYEIQYLLPDLFFDEDIVKGIFYAGLSTIMPANYFGKNKLKKTYVGVLISGSNQGGIEISPKIYTQENFVLFAHIPNPKKIEQFLSGAKDDKFKEDIGRGNVLLGYWWDINKEPEPFSSISELAKYIGAGDENKGIADLIHALKGELRSLPDTINIGLRFPGRFQNKDWQMLRLEKGTRSILFIDSDEELKERLSDYSISSVYQEYITEPYYHKRNIGRANRDVLKPAKVVLIGCGALGSEVSDCLCKAGIGNLMLVDKESLNAHNCIRHCIGLNRVTFPKVLAMAEHLALHNPFVNLELKGCDILRNNLNEYFPNGFMAVSTIADDNTESYLNEKAIEANKTVFYARALRGGKAARIFRVKPREDACKNCLALYLKDGGDLCINIQEDESLPIITNECNNPVRPASASDLKLIAAIASRIVIDYLQGVGSDKNHWILSTEQLEGIKFYDKTWGIVQSEYLPPHPKCCVCQNISEKKVFIAKIAYELMKREVQAADDLETGGVLIGYITENGEFVITVATEPGSKAIKEASLFLKDEEFTQQQLEEAFKTFGDKGLYLGEWHYHPRGAYAPSGTDIKSLTQIAKQDSYRTDTPLLIILSSDCEFGLTIHDQNGSCVKLPLEVIETSISD